MPPFALFLLGIIVGAGAAMFGPSVAPQVTRNLRPTAKAAVKTALEVGHALRVRTAELAEDIEDFVAEARAEAATPSDEDPTARQATETAPVSVPAAKRAKSKKRAPGRRKGA
jgi:hypothetical protein